MLAKDVVQLHYNSFNDRSFRQKAAQYVDPDFVMVNAVTGEEFYGVEGYKQFSEGWIGAFPDAKVVLVQQEIDSNTVRSLFRGQGKFTGQLPSPQGLIPGNGRWLDLEFEEELEVADGKLLNGRLNFDMQDMMQQLGLA